MKYFLYRVFSRLAHRRKLLFLGLGVSGFFGLVIPALVLGGNHVVDVLDSTRFCAEVCHDVHRAETLTFEASHHSQVPCSDCHVGIGTVNLVRSKILGLKDVVPALTHSYDLPISTPLESRRPSRETCETCHSASKFYGDLPLIETSYEEDEVNSQKTTTHVLKLGGGARDVAAGIHWHSTARVSYVAVDPSRTKIAWVGVESDNGTKTQYVNPELIGQLTREQIESQKRSMDCIDCHNRTPHAFEPPGVLIDRAMADGGIDSTLPFIKRESAKALTSENSTLEQAYARVSGIADFYRTAYPEVFAQKKASIDSSMARLKEIAVLTIFGNGIDYKTYSNNIGHDKPDQNMKMDWAKISSSDNSAGCFRCHGNLVRLEDAGFHGGASLQELLPAASVTPGSIKGPGEDFLVADCDTCHYTYQKDLDAPLAPSISHPTEGLEDCLVCHSPSGPRPFKATHNWSNNEACNTCHQTAPTLGLPVSARPVDARQTPHPIANLEDCLVCHGAAGPRPLKGEHPWTTNETCSGCHDLSSAPKPMPAAEPPAEAKAVPHPVANLEKCLVCHGTSSVRPISIKHPWATDETCQACHKAGQNLLVPAQPPLPVARPVNHVLPGSFRCSSCHSPAGPARFPTNHSGIPDSFCSICHQQALPPVSAPLPAPQGPSVTHQLPGSYTCTSCHKQSGPGPLPSTHVGVKDSFCLVCHKQAPAPPPPPAAPAPPAPTLPPPTTTPPPTTAPPATDAAALFSTKCSGCHGAQRQGGAGPTITSLALSGRTESWITSFLSGHNGTNLTPAQAVAMAAWLKTAP